MKGRFFCLWVALGWWGWLASPVLAQPPAGVTLMVVVPESLALDAPEVERWMERLKSERERRRWSADLLPLLRLSWGRAAHRQALEPMGLTAASGLRTYTCRRDAKGWPAAVLQAHPPGAPPDEILDAVASQSNPVATPGLEPQVGLLLVWQPEQRAQVEPFLQELGRFWLQRYGRVRPSPYPLASYDLGDPEVARAVEAAFPQLRVETPVVALCRFSEGRPQSVERLYRSWETPASLVRELSGARAALLTEPAERPSTAIAVPGPQDLSLTSEQERWLLLSRLHETAQQLWVGVQEDRSALNREPRRLLIRVIEESRQVLAGQEARWSPLEEALRDYKVEPLRLERRSRLSEQAERLLELSDRLLSESEP